MKVLDGKVVAESICKDFDKRIKLLKKEPNLAFLAIDGDEATKVYARKIEKNCEKYGIKFDLQMSKNKIEFMEKFENIKLDKTVTGIMFGQPLDKECLELINIVPPEKDVEGIGIQNMGKLFLGKDDVLIPCTSRAVIKIIEYYNIDLTGKRVVVVGRSNIVGKPLIPQLIAKNATLTICHSKTENIVEELKRADVVIMAIGKANFLKKEHIKNGAILIDVGINCVDGKIVGDIDFEDVKEKCSMITKVPGGVGNVTNALLIDNIIKSCNILK